MGTSPRSPRAVVFGCSGPELTRSESRFFASVDPVGFILFERNCEAPAQIRDLIRDLRSAVGRPNAPVLIDQEGGRVARLGPPHWRRPPAAARFGELAVGAVPGGLGVATEAVRLNARLIAAELSALGVTVDCWPVLDVPAAAAHGVIGDRALARSAALVATLGRAACEGLLAGGVAPVIKHVPGHGRATVDSHATLPTTDAPIALLEAVDFAPFRDLNAMPWAMTAHVVYAAVDPVEPATTSAPVIDDVIRRRIGFDGVLVSDDLGMGALRGSFAERARAALGAGCDLVLHASGDLDEMEDVARGSRPIGDETGRRLALAETARGRPEDFDADEAGHRLDRLLAGIEVA